MLNIKGLYFEKCNQGSKIFCLGGKSILKKLFEPRGGEKRCFRPPRGSGGMLPRKILKI